MWRGRKALKNETITPEQLKTWLINSHKSSFEIIDILEDKLSEDEQAMKMLLELKHHVKVLSLLN